MLISERKLRQFIKNVIVESRLMNENDSWQGGVNKKLDSGSMVITSASLINSVDSFMSDEQVQKLPELIGNYGFASIILCAHKDLNNVKLKAERQSGKKTLFFVYCNDEGDVDNSFKEDLMSELNVRGGILSEMSKTCWKVGGAAFANAIDKANY